MTDVEKPHYGCHNGVRPVSGRPVHDGRMQHKPVVANSQWNDLSNVKLPTGGIVPCQYTQTHQDDVYCVGCKHQAVSMQTYLDENDTCRVARDVPCSEAPDDPSVMEYIVTPLAAFAKMWAVAVASESIFKVRLERGSVHGEIRSQLKLALSGYEVPSQPWMLRYASCDESQVSHRVVSLEQHGINEYRVIIKILNTPKGLELAALIKHDPAVCPLIRAFETGGVWQIVTIDMGAV